MEVGGSRGVGVIKDTLDRLRLLFKSVYLPAGIEPSIAPSLGMTISRFDGNIHANGLTGMRKVSTQRHLFLD
ncbi:unnamed protein product [Nezara viridula]|uniref:Uncharacterized protein n=1 Tax=Nezara viridula TaxID=85310 RepID=A0A9P0HP57_NEZVI|nr:unnamed protein product [Nezara viridula]